ncbi:MAG: hypothetical protein QXM94_03565, partial [Thermoplasmata archaeon]
CGAPLEPAKQPSPPPQQYAPPVSGQPMYQPSPDMMLYSNLKSLRSAFFWMFLGIILSIIPIVDFVGVIILFIGFILLILGFGKVANTSLAHAAEYRSTKNWLLMSLIVGIVAGIVIAIIMIASLITSTVSVSGSTITSTHTLFTIGWLIVAVAILSIAYFVIYIITYLKLVSSLKSLSADLSVQSLNKAGNYLFYALIISIIGYILIPVFFYLDVFISSKTASSTSIYSILSILALPLIVMIVAYILEILSFYNAYTGIDEFLNKPRAISTQSIQQNPPQQQPPQSPEPPKFSF